MIAEGDVPLNRRFVPVPDAYQRDDVPLDEVWPSFERGGRKQWSDLLDEYRVVILADAGAGKTHEMKHAARRLAVEGRAAFFIRIEDVNQGFENSFEIGTKASFERWLAGSGEAWFFLDAVDEARLSDTRAFEEAVRAFAERIRPAVQRAHVYISSRPYAWRTSLDRAVVERLLPFEARKTEAVADDDEADDPVVEAGGRAEGDAPRVQLYMLAPLADADIRIFVQHSGIADPGPFMDELERTALLPIAQMPFDLLDLTATWRETGELGGRLEVLTRALSRQLTDLDEIGGGRFRLAAGLLAFAVIMTGQPNIGLPDSTGAALDPRDLLTGWSNEDVADLLERGVFGDPIYGQVRFRHREVRELLAAEWVAHQMARGPEARAEFERLIFRSSYEWTVLAVRLRPILPWLILFDDQVCAKVLALDPEVATEGGDAARLPRNVRERMLDDLVKTVVTVGSSFRGLDNSAIARIAQRDVESRVLALTERYYDDDEAIFVLGRLSWQGKMSSCAAPLAKIAADPKRGIYARIVSVRVVASQGGSELLRDTWTAINDCDVAIPRRLLAELAAGAPPNEDSVDLVLASIERLESREAFEVSGLTTGLNEMIERLPNDDDVLTRLNTGFRDLLVREPHVERGECHVSEEYSWLMNPALHVVERLIRTHSKAALSDTTLEVLSAAPALRFWRGDDYAQRKDVVADLVPQWPELNDALFWWTVERRREALAPEGKRVTDSWAVTFIDHFCSFDAASFSRTVRWIGERELPDDRLVALSRAVRTYNENGRPDRWLEDIRDAIIGTPDLEAALKETLNPLQPEKYAEYQREEKRRQRERKRRAKVDAKDRSAFAARLQADPSLVSRPGGVDKGMMTNTQYNLLRILEGEGVRSSRAQGADWRRLVPQFGEEVAAAYREAARRHWREYDPAIRSEGGVTNSIPYSLIFAMAGLDIELGEEDALARLSPGEAGRAFRYSIWELNGFPRWFEALYRSRPEIGRAFVWKEVEWELNNSPPDEPIHYMLSNLVYHAPWLHPEIGPLLFDWLQTNRAPNQSCLDNARSILMGAGIEAPDIAALARRMATGPTTPDDQRMTWLAMWTDSDPPPAISESERTLPALPDPEASGSVYGVSLVGGRRSQAPVFGSFRTPTYLKQLYLLMHRVVPVSNDIDRVGKGVYSPTLRDNAQEARERLFSLLNDISGPLAYRAIEEIAVSHPAPSYREYVRRQVHLHAVIDGDVFAWKATQVAELAGRIAPRYDAPAGNSHAAD